MSSHHKTPPKPYTPSKIGFRIWPITVYIYWSKTLWENTLQDCDNTEQKHLITLCRATSKDGIRLWQACFLWLRVVWGMARQTPRPQPAALETNAVIDRARTNGRDYITPQDVGAALEAGIPPAKVRIDTLQVLANLTGFGAEDRVLCAFNAYRGEEYVQVRRQLRIAPDPS